MIVKGEPTVAHIKVLTGKVLTGKGPTLCPSLELTLLDYYVQEESCHFLFI